MKSRINSKTLLLIGLLSCGGILSTNAIYESPLFRAPASLHSGSSFSEIDSDEIHREIREDLKREVDQAIANGRKEQLENLKADIDKQIADVGQQKIDAPKAALAEPEIQLELKKDEQIELQEQLSQAQSELDTHKEKLKKANEDLLNAADKIAGQDSDLENAMKEMAEMGAHLDRSKQDTNDVIEAYQKLEIDHKKAKHKVAELEEELAQAKQDATDLTKDWQAIDIELRKAKEVEVQLHEDLVRSKQDTDDVIKAYQDIEVKHKLALDKLSTMKEDLDRANQDTQDVIEAYLQQDLEKRAIEDKLAKANKDLHQAEQDIIDLTHSYHQIEQKLRVENDKLVAELEIKEVELKKLSDLLAAALAQNEELEDAFKAKKEELDQRICTQKDQIAELEEEIEGLVSEQKRIAETMLHIGGRSHSIESIMAAQDLGFMISPLQMPSVQNPYTFVSPMSQQMQAMDLFGMSNPMGMFSSPMTMGTGMDMSQMLMLNMLNRQMLMNGFMNNDYMGMSYSLPDFGQQRAGQRHNMAPMIQNHFYGPQAMNGMPSPAQPQHGNAGIDMTRVPAGNFYTAPRAMGPQPAAFFDFGSRSN